MSFGYARNSGINWFRDYGDALHKYENTTDIRGRTTEPMRPLGHRKSIDMYSIRKLENGDIECVCYKTPVVTFHTDNTITLQAGGWASQTTVNFIDDVLGLTAVVFDRSICISTNPRGEYFRMDNREPFKMEKDEHGYWQPVTIRQEFIHRIRRKESNKVMKECEGLLAYLENMRKLRHDGEMARFSKEEIEQTFGEAKDNYHRRLDISLDSHYASASTVFAKFRDWMTDQSEDKHLSYYKAMLVLVNTVGAMDWHTEERRMRAHHWLEAKTMLKNMVWGFHRDEVFEPVAVKVGAVKRDTYGRFFDGAWEKYHGELSSSSS